jgi:hypothetical protein
MTLGAIKMTTEFVYVMNQAGRDQLRDALVGCLKTDMDPDRYAEALVNDADVTTVHGEPEVSFEIQASHNIYGIPFTIDIAGPQFFNAEPLDA